MNCSVDGFQFTDLTIKGAFIPFPGTEVVFSVKIQTRTGQHKIKNLTFFHTRTDFFLPLAFFSKKNQNITNKKN